MAIALIAQQYLDPGVKTRVATLLAADPDNLTKHDIASEPTKGGPPALPGWQ